MTYRPKLQKLLAANDAALPPFLVSVFPKKDESLLSFIARTAEANVFERLTDILSLSGMSKGLPAYIPFTRFEDVERLSSSFSIELSDIRNRTHRPIDHGGTLNLVDWYGENLPRKFIDACLRRYSPAALRQSNHHRARWMLKPLGFCPETMELLQSRCPHCERETEWKFTLGIGRCEYCRKSLRKFKPGKLPWHLRNEATLVAALVSTEASERAGAVLSYPAPFCHWQAGDIFAAVVELGAIASNSNSDGQSSLVESTSKGDFSTFAPENLIAGHRLLQRWPGSLETLATECMKRLNSGDTALITALRKYERSNAANTPIRILLRSQLPLLLFEAGAPMKVFRHGRSGWLPPNTILITDAAKEFGMSLITLRRLGDQGLCVRTKQMGKKKGGATLYNYSMLKTSIDLLRNAMRASDCAAALGMPRHCVEYLADCGFISRVDDRDALLMAQGMLFDRESVEELVTKLDHVEVSGGAPDISLAGALTQILDPQIWADALARLLTGQLLLARRDGSGKSAFERLLVDEASVRQFLSSVPERILPKDVLVTCETAGKLLNVCEVFVCGAVRVGLIPAVKVSARRTNISLFDLGVFKSLYITNSEGGKKLGVAPPIFGRDMVASGFKSVAKVYSVSVWKRGEAEQLLSNRSSSSYDTK